VAVGTSAVAVAGKGVREDGTAAVAGKAVSRTGANVTSVSVRASPVTVNPGVGVLVQPTSRKPNVPTSNRMRFIAEITFPRQAKPH
jgi:hypothetical protein